MYSNLGPLVRLRLIQILRAHLSNMDPNAVLMVSISWSLLLHNLSLYAVEIGCKSIASFTDHEEGGWWQRAQHTEGNLTFHMLQKSFNPLCWICHYIAYCFMIFPILTSARYSVIK